MIAERGEVAIKDKCVYLRFPTEEEAQKFYDSLHALNRGLNGRVITFLFDTEAEAQDFHDALIRQFGELKNKKCHVENCEEPIVGMIPMPSEDYKTLEPWFYCEKHYRVATITNQLINKFVGK